MGGVLLGASMVERLLYPFRRSRLQPAGYHLGVSGVVCTFRVASAPVIRLGKELDCDAVRRVVECRRVDTIRLYPGRWYLLLSEEEVRLPEDVAAYVQLRSTPARLGVIMPPTFVDPGFRGRLVLEVSTLVPVELEPGYELAHINFMLVHGDTMGGYSGVYQNQAGVKIRNCVLEVVESGGAAGAGQAPTGGPRRGLLVAVEGLDGTGVTTFSRMLVEALRGMGARAVYTKEPTASGDPGSKQPETPGELFYRAVLGLAPEGLRHPLVAAALLAADRYYHLYAMPLECGGRRYRGIVEAVENGCIVVTDRYVLSSLVYQRAEALRSGVDVTADWIAALNRYTLPPDVIIMVEGVQRRATTVYDTDAWLQQAALGLYDELLGDPGRLAGMLGWPRAPAIIRVGNTGGLGGLEREAERLARALMGG